MKIAGILLDELTKRCKEQLSIDVSFKNSVTKWLAETGYDVKYGARPLKRAIQNKLEDPMADEILEGRFMKGSCGCEGGQRKSEDAGEGVQIMKKNASVFFCQECGYESAKWLGQCPACHEWNTFAEEPKVSTSRGKMASSRPTGGGKGTGFFKTH